MRALRQLIFPHAVIESVDPLAKVQAVPKSMSDRDRSRRQMCRHCANSTTSSLFPTRSVSAVRPRAPIQRNRPSAASSRHWKTVLGAVLIERNRSGICLTPAGAEVVAIARRMLKDAQSDPRSDA